MDFHQLATRVFTKVLTPQFKNLRSKQGHLSVKHIDMTIAGRDL